MKQLTDIPYSILKDNKRAYEIMLLRDLCDNSFTDIATQYKISAPRIKEIYRRIKVKKMRLYINHLAIVRGHENTDIMKRIYREADDCYQEDRYVAAYFEKEYNKILKEYRAGEPGISEQFIATLPPYKKEFEQDVIDRVIQLRETENKPYLKIGNELQMTAQKAEKIYDMYYHKKVLAIFDAINQPIGGKIWNHYFRITYNSKKRYELLLQDYPDILINPDTSGQVGPKCRGV